jgi:rhamnose utilization protein RhaD (predicted bifunctional aldolase and dehydrogenase)
MTYTNRTQRRQDAASDRIDTARRQTLVNAIGILARNRESTAAEILREILNKDAGNNSGQYKDYRR